MKALTKILIIGLSFLFGEMAMADERSPGMTEIALDIEITSGKADLRIDDVPFFGPGEMLEAEASIIASLPANAIMGPGENQVILQFWPAESGLGNTPRFRARFGYAEAGTYPDAFSDRPFAILVDIQPDPKAPSGYRLDQAVTGQPLMTGKLTKPDLTALPDGGLEVALKLDIGIDLPAQQWKTGQNIGDDKATQDQVETLMRQAHSAFAEGPAAIARELGPLLERLAATSGMSIEDIMQTDYAPYVDKSIGFELQPFDASGSKLMILGNGRLATLVPPPVAFENAEINESLSPLLAYWRDNRGDWQILH